MPIPVIAIFDVGKTNKKLLLFDLHYRVCWEESVQLRETVDEDGFPCEDVAVLTAWVKEQAAHVLTDPRWEVRAINFAAYGASFVHLDREGRVIAPLYNYLKPYPKRLLEHFYNSYGGAGALSRQTASSLNDSLSSGLQLYRLKYEQPALFADIAWSLHLPQYLSFVLGGPPAADITSTGCHTGLWDFEAMAYHRWVREEGIDKKIPPILPSDTCQTVGTVRLGIGLHDSSSALIPYLRTVSEPFLQLSTGTWCVSLNPFNATPLTSGQLQQDCLCYISYKGNPVKASRLFAGHAHEQQARRLALHFHKPANHFETVRCDTALLERLEQAGPPSGFLEREPGEFPDYETAYHRLMLDLVYRQADSTRLVLEGSGVSQVLVDGGFSKNPIFMHLLARAFPGQQVRAASVAQATAVGAALCLHEHWNGGPVPSHLMAGKG
ncbi:FGGY-family carbohydrate kinase [Dinghuibacter silviterrae]|uniref:Sugar (Pentulose or hexulose) kinase n=1 Tax=Dinghuibacter silviterrae TaxID=1539049 RepID=A0A4R8DH61_9BACT|nr:FGGY-family carbohydrate kinase [Dinghuibacter silviterrae]TDW96865.1 sugar (pentulose or hexulose) kinase [Dinghuibacter silviterrae]